MEKIKSYEKQNNEEYEISSNLSENWECLSLIEVILNTGVGPFLVKL